MELLERETFLDELRRLQDETAKGYGRLVLLGGEAGVGKTALVDEFCRLVQNEIEPVRASFDALSTPSPLSSIRSFASALRVAFEPHLREGHHRDELFHAIFDAIARRGDPVLMVAEDAHWADEASLAFVRFAGRRIDRLRLLLVVTYRDDEIGPHHPLRRILGDLATARGVRRLLLSPLSEAAVHVLAAGRGPDPVALHRQTGGNPFFVTEVLAAGGNGVPATVSDAVLARASRLSPAAGTVLNAAAAIGAEVDPEVLAGVTGPALDEIEECVAHGLLRPAGNLLVFRHQLARDAVYAGLLPPRRRLLHGRILTVLRDLPDQERHLARLAHHAELAGDPGATFTFATAAAAQATRLHAHREAAEQYARALRFAGTLPAAERARLLEARAYECYLTDQILGATAARRAALTLWRGLGDRTKEGENLRWLSRLYWFAGRNLEADEAAQAALAALEPLPPGPQLAWAYSNLAQLRMLARDSDGAVVWGDRAIALAERLGEQEILVHALNNVGTARLHDNDDGGRAQLEGSLVLALETGLEEHAARAWTNLASASVSCHRFPAAERYLAHGIAYSSEHDLDSWRVYMTAWRAVLRLRQGDWPRANEDASWVTYQSWAPINRIVALTVLGRLQARRGDPATTALDEALALALPTGEAQRLGPIRAARAEAAWLAGDVARAAVEARASFDLVDQSGDRWLRGELAFWLQRADERAAPGGELAEPFALQVAGDWAAAAAAWEALGCPYEAAWARADGDDETELRQALAAFERLGAAPAAAVARRRLRRVGARVIPRGPRPATRAHPAGLTSREVEILELVVQGCSNPEIAARLYLSPKTVEHHVSAILAKLGVPSRREATRAAARFGLTSSP